MAFKSLCKAGPQGSDGTWAHVPGHEPVARVPTLRPDRSAWVRTLSPSPSSAPLAAFAHRACFARRELRTLAHERRLRTGLLTWSLLHKRGLLSPLRAHPTPPEAAQAAFFLGHPWAVLQGPTLAPAAAPRSNPAEWRHPGPRAGSSPRAPQRAALLGQYTC